MDVSEWSIASKMKMPDHNFGNRWFVDVYGGGGVDATFSWSISGIALPNIVCIWDLVMVYSPNLGGRGYCRIGLADVVPTSEAEMNAAMEIFPQLGEQVAGPNRLMFYGERATTWAVPVRKGMVTGEKYLVMESWCSVNTVRYNAILVVSLLPDLIPGWPGAWPAG